MNITFDILKNDLNEIKNCQNYSCKDFFLEKKDVEFTFLKNLFTTCKEIFLV